MPTLYCGARLILKYQKTKLFILHIISLPKNCCWELWPITSPVTCTAIRCYHPTLRKQTHTHTRILNIYHCGYFPFKKVMWSCHNYWLDSGPGTLVPRWRHAELSVAGPFAFSTAHFGDHAATIFEGEASSKRFNAADHTPGAALHPCRASPEAVRDIGGPNKGA